MVCFVTPAKSFVRLTEMAVRRQCSTLMSRAQFSSHLQPHYGRSSGRKAAVLPVQSSSRQREGSCQKKKKSMLKCPRIPLSLQKFYEHVAGNCYLLGRYFAILKSSAFCLPPSSGLQLLEVAQKWHWLHPFLSLYLLSIEIMLLNNTLGS